MRQFAEELWRGERRRRSSRAHYAAYVRTYVCLSGLRRRTLSKWARADIMRPRDLQPRRVAICTPCKRPRYVTQERDNNGKLPPRCKYVPLHKSDESSVLFFPFCVVFVFCPFCQFTSPMTCHVWEFPARVLTFMCQQKGRERKKRSVHILRVKVS